MGPQVPIGLDHVGIAVHSISDAEGVLFALGGERVGQGKIDGATWSTYKLDTSPCLLELLEPSGTESFLSEFLKENGSSLHHVTVEVGDISKLIAHLKERGVPVVDYREQSGWIEAYISPKNPTGTLFQLIEYTPA